MRNAARSRPVTRVSSAHTTSAARKASKARAGHVAKLPKGVGHMTNLPCSPSGIVPTSQTLCLHRLGAVNCFLPTDPPFNPPTGRAAFAPVAFGRRHS